MIVSFHEGISKQQIITMPYVIPLYIYVYFFCLISLIVLIVFVYQIMLKFMFSQGTRKGKGHSDAHAGGLGEVEKILYAGRGCERGW